MNNKSLLELSYEIEEVENKLKENLKYWENKADSYYMNIDSNVTASNLNALYNRYLVLDANLRYLNYLLSKFYVKGNYYGN